MICMHCSHRSYTCSLRLAKISCARSTSQSRTFVTSELCRAAQQSSSRTQDESTNAAQLPEQRPQVQHAVSDVSVKSTKGAKLRSASSAPAGISLRGLNYFKNKEDPIALEDEEYPDWLWKLLDEKKGPLEGQKEEVDPRIYSKSAKARQMANKRIRKLAAKEASSVRARIPLFEQSIDLPAGDGTQHGVMHAIGARQELTHAMRVKRRKDIKEANFLKGM